MAFKFRSVLSLSIGTGALLSVLMVWFAYSRIVAVRDLQNALIEDLSTGYTSVAFLERGMGFTAAGQMPPEDWWQAVNELTLPSGCCVTEWQGVAAVRTQEIAQANRAIGRLANAIMAQLSSNTSYLRETKALNESLAVTVAASFVGICFICWLLVNQGILRPINRLLRALDNHADTGEFQFSATPRDAQELALLAEQIGTIIAQLESDLLLTQGRLDEARETAHLEAAAMADELAELIDGSSSPIFTLDNRGVIASWNRKVAAITGIPYAAAHGKQFDRGFLDASERIGFNDVIKRALAGMPVEGYQIGLLTESGGPVSLLLNITPKRDEAGEVTGVTCFGAQVDDFLETTAKVIEKQRVDHFNDLASGAAHQLNQPLQKMRLLLVNAQNRLRREEVDKEQVIDKLRGADAELSAMSEIVEHLRLFGRKAPPIEGGFVLAEIVDRCVDLAKGGFLDQGINLSVSNELGGHKVNGHPVQIEKILMAILENSREALIASRASEPSVKASAWVTPDARQARLSIKDNGGGVDIALQDKIFDAFFTTKTGGRNVGLGLTSARALVEDMGGAVQLTSMGESTVFEIVLPLIMRGATDTEVNT